MQAFAVMLLCLAGCASCTQHHAEPDAWRADAPRDVAVDATRDAPSAPCDVTKPFGTPVLVPGVNTTGSETAGWMSDDQLAIYFNRGTGGGDIYVATRSTLSDPFTSGAKVAAIDASGFAMDPALTADGLTIFLAAGPAGATPHIYSATRSSTASAFGASAAVTSVNSTIADDESPWISADGLQIYFASNRLNNLDLDLYTASRTDPVGGFSTPTNVASLNTSAQESFPVVSADGLEIFFASNRPGTGTGSIPNAIWHATRASTAVEFDPPTVEAEVSDPAGNDAPTWLSPDRCLLLLSSNRAGGVGSYDLWMARRPR